MSDAGEALSTTLVYSVNGVEYTFSKITLGIMADFETTMAMRRVQRTRKALGEDATPAERQELVYRMMSQPTAGMSLDELQSMEGIRTMLYLCLKPNHPELTEDAVGQLVTFRTIREMQDLMDLLIDLPAIAALEESQDDVKN